MTLRQGDQAPEFQLPDQNGQQHKLSDYKEQWVLLYFYPRDNTPGCTVEACTIRDSYPDFEKLNIKVFGISKDSVKSHAGFAKKHDLPFTLLSDEDKKMQEDYGVWQKKKFMGREYMGTERMSYLIDPPGKIAQIFHKVKPKEHAQDVLGEIRKNA